MFSRNALVAAVVFALAGCGGSGSDSASVSSGTGSENAQPAKPGGPRALPEGEGEIRVLSNRADLISGGDALVEVVAENLQDARVFLNDEDISGQFPEAGEGAWRGLVNGPHLGSITLEVLLARGNSRTATTITNQPKRSPVYSALHVPTWNWSEAAAVDGACDQPPYLTLKRVPAEQLTRLFTEFVPDDPGLPDGFLP